MFFTPIFHFFMYYKQHICESNVIFHKHKHTAHFAMENTIPPLRLFFDTTYYIPYCALIFYFADYVFDYVHFKDTYVPILLSLMQFIITMPIW